MAKRQFNAAAAERARMSRDELTLAVNERIKRDGIVLPLEAEARQSALADLVIVVVYERYRQECEIDEDIEKSVVGAGQS